MNRLYYQPIAAPQVGGASSSVTQAASAIGAGFDRIGSGLTRLGERRQERQELKQAQANQRAQEQFALLAQNVKSEEELDALTTNLLGLNSGPTAAGPQGQRGGGPPSLGGTNVPGLSDILAGRRENLLANNTTRLNNEGKSESNRAARITNDGSQLGLDRANLANEFQKEFGPQIAEARRLASVGDLQGAQALEADIARTATSKYGSDLVTSLYEGTLGLATSGDSTRTGITQNRLGIAETELNLRGTRQTQNIRAAEAADADRTRDFNFGRDQIAANRQDAEFVRGEVVQEAVAQVASGAFSREDALQRVQGSNLTAREKVATSQALAAAFDANSNLLDTTNPLDPNLVVDRIFNRGDRQRAEGTFDFGTIIGPDGVPRYGKSREPTNSNLDPASTVAGIQSASRTVQQTRPALAIFNEVQNVEASLAESGGNNVNLGEQLRTRYEGTQLPDKWLNRIERAQRGKPGERALTDAEVMVIADRSFRARGANYLGVNLLPGGERADERILDVDLFDQIAKDYRAANPSNLAAQSRRIRDYNTRASSLQSSISSLENERARAIQANDNAAKTRLDRRISDSRDELAGIARRVDGMLQVNSTNQ